MTRISTKTAKRARSAPVPPTREPSAPDPGKRPVVIARDLEVLLDALNEGTITLRPQVGDTNMDITGRVHAKLRSAWRPSCNRSNLTGPLREIARMKPKASGADAKLVPNVETWLGGGEGSFLSAVLKS